MGRKLYEFDGLIRLLVALFDQAHRDARQGKADALHFLDQVAPGWREMQRRRQRKVVARKVSIE